MRAEQAIAERIDSELAIRMTGSSRNRGTRRDRVDPAGACREGAGIDWAKPLAEWPRETMVEFLTVAFELIRKAVTARDLSTSGITRKSNAAEIARQANAAAGGPLSHRTSSTTRISII